MHSNVRAHAHIANVTQPKRSPVFFILKRMQKHSIQHIWLIIQRQRMIFVYSPYPIWTEWTSQLKRQTNKQIKLGKHLHTHEIFISFWIYTRSNRFFCAIFHASDLNCLFIFKLNFNNIFNAILSRKWATKSRMMIGFLKTLVAKCAVLSVVAHSELVELQVMTSISVRHSTTWIYVRTSIAQLHWVKIVSGFQIM